MANILTLVAYEQAQRDLRGVCEPTVAEATVFEPRHRLRIKKQANRKGWHSGGRFADGEYTHACRL